MTILTLNLWGGQVYGPLLAFLKARAEDTDVFCFQEVIFGGEPGFTTVHKARLNLFADIEACLPDFNAFTYHAPEDVPYFQSEVLPEGAHAGQAIFVRKSLTVTDQGGFRTYEGAIPKETIFGGKITGSCMWVGVKKDEEALTILNLHGLWQKDTNKIDTAERLVQSKILTDFMKQRSGLKLLCGDFNLIPNGQAMRVLEQGMKNLVKDYGIASTRSELYTKPEKFADYVIASPTLRVLEFGALLDIVSDHLALHIKIA